MSIVLEDLTEEEKEKLVKIKKKMKRKVSWIYIIYYKKFILEYLFSSVKTERLICLMQARMKRKEDAKIKKIRQEKRKAKVWLYSKIWLKNNFSFVPSKTSVI